MQCPQCQHENAPDAKFCNQCGTALAPKCPSCGHESAFEAKFCNQCGTPLTPASQSAIVADKPTQPKTPTPDAERRQLTVMFCDLADSTRLSGQLDPEDLRDVIRAYQSTSAEVIERYDGYIAQHLGDGLMVYFGWPQAHEDDAQRAVHAGLGILEAMRGLNTRLEVEKGIRLAVRIGIHTGLVVVGEIGQGASQEHLALGETPNVASRIEGIAEPDTVAISAATLQLVEGYFSCRDLGKHDFKGVAEPMRVYGVLGESGVQSRLDIISAHGLTPLVGRESEVTLLLERWQQVKDGHGQVVLLSGEAGIGKSRLLQVMKDHVSGDAHTLLECRSSSYYENTALFPITDMLQRVLDWNQDETPEAKLDKLEQTLRVYRAELEEAVPLFATLLSLPMSEGRYPPLKMSPQQRRQKTLETLLAVLLGQAIQQPLLFIIEDLHWTDPSTLELLDHLIEQTPTVAIMVLLTCRPMFQPSWSSRSYLAQVTLNHLSQEPIKKMSMSVAGGKQLPDEVLQQIIDKTDGVPLFVEEITKAIIESGLLKEANDHYELTGRSSHIEIPVTLQDSLMARLDRLDTAKSVAQLGATIGRQFSYDLLHLVSQLDDVALHRELSRLVDAELLYQRGVPPRATYLFKHALIQDIAYQSLLKSTRQQYHQRIAQVLEAHFAETTATQPELLAHHYTAAGLHEPAVAYWHKAGQRAIERSAHAEAIQHFTAALETLKLLPQTRAWIRTEIDIQTALGAVFIAAQGWGTTNMEQAYARALELARQIDDPVTLLPILVGVWAIYQVRADLHQTLEQAEQILSLAPRVQDTYSIPVAHQVIAEPLLFQGKFAAAHEHFTHAFSGVDPAYPRPAWMWFDLRVDALAHQTLTLWCLGYPSQALTRGYEAGALAEEVVHPWTSGYSVLLVTVCLFSHCRRDSPKILEGAEALMALAHEQGFAALHILGTCWRGWALVEAGQPDEGLTQIRQGLAAWEAIGAGLWRPTLLALLAQAYVATGHVEDGLVVLAEALALVEPTGERWYEAELHHLKGTLLLSQAATNCAEAEACFHQTLSIARSQEAKSWELRAATSLARLWQSQDKRQAAYDLLAPIYGWFTEGFDTLDLKEAKGLLDELS